MIDNSKVIENKCNMYDREINKLQQRSREFNIEISNFPSTPGENVMEIVSEVAKHVGFNLEKGDIVRAHRVPAFNKEAVQGIIVRLNSVSTKLSFIDAFSKNKKGGFSPFELKMGLKNDKGKIFVNEHLCPYYKKLLSDAKKLARTHNFKYVWYKDYEILVKKDEKAKTVKVFDLESLKKIIK